VALCRRGATAEIGAATDQWLRGLGRRALAITQSFVKPLNQILRGLGMTVPGGNIASAPASRKAAKS